MFGSRENVKQLKVVFNFGKKKRGRVKEFTVRQIQPPPRAPTKEKGTICANVDVYDAKTAPGVLVVRLLCLRCERPSRTDVFRGRRFCT